MGHHRADPMENAALATHYNQLKAVDSATYNGAHPRDTCHNHSRINDDEWAP
jgi:hypothetical protein